MRTINLMSMYLLFLLLIVVNFNTSPVMNVTSKISSIQPDGIITEHEYSFSESFNNDDFILYWEIQNSTIYFGLVGKTSGWL